MSTGKYFRIPLLTILAVALCCGCGGRGGQGAASTKANPAPSGPVQYTYKIVNTYPHDVASYTQGLLWHDGELWEGTGEYGHSQLRRIDLPTGRALKSVALDSKYFGEGIALLGGKIYQLTWLEGEALVYDAATMKPLRRFTYPGEGWGLTTDGEKLYMSDGSHRIYIVDPADFSRKGTISVTLSGREVKYLNELEWIEGRIWANVYGSDSIVIIDPATGDVKGVIDLTGILPASERTTGTDVLNGIAYDAQAKRIFVTGKRWPKIYEIELLQK